ncbi:OsmC family protein [Sphingobacterium griseoflavum]|uniref:Osmotically inducible protein C n=1 Tax=Sphingobacterium griseoflavum TaxID=1474952 RepID=A0ABQ3HZ62_9SPHI|nr:OsmC family protein [Sphingobacterium griseoflavum]GHE34785.1 osmotically inducible protein C [Sphingobacterium griseoflavum]
MERDIIVKIGRERYKTEIEVAQHKVYADEPKNLGGTDLGPSPAELLLSSLGTCKAMTLRMYADRKEWDLASVEIKMSMSEQRTELQKTTFIHCHIRLHGDLDETQKGRLLLIADRCPVHKILTSPIIIESNLV